MHTCMLLWTAINAKLVAEIEAELRGAWKVKVLYMKIFCEVYHKIYIQKARKKLQSQSSDSSSTDGLLRLSQPHSHY